MFAFKQARRREDDIAIVNTGMRVLFEKETNSSSWKIKDCSFSFGGLAPTTVMAMKTIKGLTGRYADGDHLATIREPKHIRFWDVNGSWKLSVLFPGACYGFFLCRFKYKNMGYLDLSRSKRAKSSFICLPVAVRISKTSVLIIY